MSMFSSYELFSIAGAGCKTHFGAFMSFLSLKADARLAYMNFGFYYMTAETEVKSRLIDNPYTFHDELSNIDVTDIIDNALSIRIEHKASGNFVALCFDLKTGNVVYSDVSANFETDYNWELCNRAPMHLFKDTKLGIALTPEFIFFTHDEPLTGTKMFFMTAWAVRSNYSLERFLKLAVGSRFTGVAPQASRISEWKTLMHQEYLYGFLAEGFDPDEFKSYRGNIILNSENVLTIKQVLEAKVGHAEVERVMTNFSQHAETVLNIMNRALERMEKNS